MQQEQMKHNPQRKPTISLVDIRYRQAIIRGIRDAVTVRVRARSDKTRVTRVSYAITVDIGLNR